MATNSYASKAGGHVNSIIEYINDVKPYHTKLTGVSESYLFSEQMSVSTVDSTSTTSFLGADLLRLGNGTRLPRSSSWYMTGISDGARLTWPVPVTSFFKYTAQLAEDVYTVGSSDSLLLPGIAGYSFRSSIAAPLTVRKNGTVLNKGADYFVSRGICTISTLPSAKWIRRDIKSLSTSGLSGEAAATLKLEESGALSYSPVLKPYGSITAISGGNYEEWTLTCVGTLPATLNVVGSTSGLIGTAIKGIPFSHPKISFTFSEVSGLSPSDPETTELGDVFVLTPTARITVNPASPVQDWTIIKTDSNFQVYGSVSGWQPPAQDEWYYNGHIGFKIPRLELWATYSHNTTELVPSARTVQLRATDHMCRTTASATSNSVGSPIFAACVNNQPQPLDSVSFPAVSRPSHYSIRFVSPTRAIVTNSRTQIRRGLTVGEIWTDGEVSFRFKNTMTYQVGDVFCVFVTHKMEFADAGWYDELEYDTFEYDQGINLRRTPVRWGEEYLPFHVGHEAVVFKSENLVAGDVLQINKAIADRIRFKIDGADNYAALGSESNWIPLELRINSTAPALATEITAYLAGNSSESGKVFTVSQPASAIHTGNSSATLTFNSSFFNTYMPLNTPYVLAFIQEEKYGQSLSVQMTEALTVAVNSIVTTSSYYLTFDNSWLSLPASSDNLFPGDFTIEAWINIPNTSNYPPNSQPYSIFGVGGTGANFDFRWFAGNFEVSLNDSSATALGGAISNNAWTHVALVRSGSSIRCYVNGTWTGITITNATPLGNSTDDAYVGASDKRANSPINIFAGKISNLRIVKGSALYTTNFTKPIPPLSAVSNTVLLTARDATIIDRSPGTRAITANGTVASTVWSVPSNI